MRMRRAPNQMIRVLVAVLLLGLAVALVSAPKQPFTTSDKAYYLDPKMVDFVRPGLVMKVTGVNIAANGTVTVRIKLTDPRGLPLDREGNATPGNVAVSIVAAHIPKGQSQYVSYTTRVQTSPITGKAATQAAADSGGTWRALAIGEYEYTLNTRLPSGYDRTVTHTIGIYGNRNLNEFNLGIQYDDDFYNFVPDGSAVKVVRDIIRTQSCNKCHDPLALHGGSRRSMEVCNLCHTPQTTDPDTGNTVDMPVMTHRIHMGEDLPSVQAGGKYVIIGNQQSVHDFSTVVFPASPQRCQTCHESNTGAAQKDNWLTNPSRAACGACHDNVNFDTGANHANGIPQPTDNMCATCHIPQGENDFDASIKGAHVIATESSLLPGIVFEVLEIADGVAGKRPTVTFSLKNKSGTPIRPNEMNRLRLILAGPNTDYASYVSEDVLTATGTADGRYFWTFQNPIPADAKGSYTIGMEGYRNTVLFQGTLKEMTVRDAGVNKTKAFSVDGSPVAARRTVISWDNCNRCHGNLIFHGGNRNRIEQCVICHNPNLTGAATGSTERKSVQMATMIHKIHTGENLTTSYVIGNFNFGHVRYPGDRRNCNACHTGNSQQLPARPGLLPVSDPSGYVNPILPEAAACRSCHDAKYVASHTVANTTALGESCATCHSTTSEFSVNRAHAR